MNLPKISMSAAVEAVMTLIDSDNIMSKYVFKEGDKVTNLVYRDGNGVCQTVEEAIIDTILINSANSPSSTGPILDGRPTSFLDNPAVCPISASTKYTVIPTAMVLDIAKKNRSRHIRVDFKNVIRVGSISATIAAVTVDTLPTGGIAAAISTIEDGGEIALSAGAYNMESGITLDKSVTITGPNDVPQKARAKTSNIIRADNATDIPGAVINGSCTINNAAAEIVFRGISFTGNFRPIITAAKSVSFVNCRFEDIIAPNEKSMLFTLDATATTKVIINGCYFGAPAVGSSGKMYHITEMNGKLETNSSFSNNYLDVDCCTHNAFNIYDVVDDAVINVNNNYIYKSAALSRIGIKGAAKATINYHNNEYDSTDIEEWAGLVSVQPYGKQTTDMSGWAININKTINNTKYEQLVVVYFNPTDMPYDETKLPKIYVDGKVCADYKIINEQASTSTETDTATNCESAQ